MKTVTTSRSGQSCSRCMTTSPGGAASAHLGNYRPREFPPIFSGCYCGGRIPTHDDSWESHGPPEVAELIKRGAFFGYVKPGRE